MKLLISLSVATFEEGARVAVEFDKDDWSIGTVIKATPTGYKIDFDYGEKGRLIKLKDAKVVLVDQKRQYKKPLSAAQVKALKPAKAAKPAAVKAAPVKIAKPAPAKTKTVVKVSKPARPVEKKTAKPDYSKDSHEQITLEKKVGNVSAWANAVDGGASAQRDYIELVWHNTNARFFGSKLAAPNFLLMKNMGAQNFSGLGMWLSHRRHLKISPRLFLSTEAQAVTTIVHEICHQAVSEIDKVRETYNGGHGSYWSAWMQKCGLTPARYSNDDRTDFMTEHEAKEHVKLEEEHKQRVEKRTAAHQKADMPRLYIPRDKYPAQYFDAEKSVWVKGLIVAPNDQAGKRWMFILEPSSARWKIIPHDWFHELPREERPVYQTQAFMDAANTIMGYKDTKSELRGKRKALRSLYGSLFR